MKIGILMVLALILFASPLLWDMSPNFSPHLIEKWLKESGFIAPFLYMALMALAVVVSPIPSLPLNIAAGAFFGPLIGTVYSVIGALFGAVVSFMIARSLGRGVVERFLGGHVNFCTECSDHVLTKVVFLSRLIPFLSFDVVSYGAGLTRMSLSRFVLATFFGMIPLTLVYNYFGAVLVIGKAASTVLGIAMVLLFFLFPRWLERRGIFPGKRHTSE